MSAASVAAGPVPPTALEAALTRQAIVLISCGGRKAVQPSIAGELYTGPYFRACLRAAQAIVPDGRIYILSARYGLLSLEDGPVEPYELRLGQPGSVTAAAVHGQAASRGLSGRPVITLCGARYATLAAQVWAEVTTPLAGLGIGQQLHVLSILRAGSQAAHAAPEGGRGR